MTKVVVLTAPDENDLPGLDELPDDVQLEHVRGEDALRTALPEADVLVVTDFNDNVLERCWPDEHKIRWVHATSAGVDALMFPALADSDIPITNARGVFDRGIAEYVLGAVLLFAKDTMGNLHYQQNRQWQHRETELIRDQRALIVGAGSIGGEVAKLLSSVGVSVTGLARTAREAPHFESIEPSSQLLELLPQVDYVVITAPLNKATEGLFDEQAFAAMKPGARLINVGRGPIVKTDDLVQALREGRISGAALDVFEEEPLPEDHPLWNFPQVMISAHMAGDFIGWRQALGEQFVENFQRWHKGEKLFNQVTR